MAAGVIAVAAGVTALTCGALSAASWRAMINSGNASLSWFTAGFAVLGVKNAAKSIMGFAAAPGSEAIEGIFSLADLLAVALIAWPLVAARRGAL